MLPSVALNFLNTEIECSNNDEYQRDNKNQKYQLALGKMKFGGNSGKDTRLPKMLSIGAGRLCPHTIKTILPTSKDLF